MCNGAMTLKFWAYLIFTVGQGEEETFATFNFFSSGLIIKSIQNILTRENYQMQLLTYAWEHHMYERVRDHTYMRGSGTECENEVYVSF